MAEKKELTVQNNQPAVTPMQLLQVAMDKGADLDKLEQLMELQERWEAKEAKKAYHQAVAAFKAENIKVFKESHVSFRNKAGTLTEYDHANLGNFVENVAGKLSDHALSHSWSMAQDNGQITVTCKLSHIGGHSESVNMTAGADESGGKNKIQAVASTNTYLQRYTFKALLGLAEHDNDGKGADPEPVDVIDEEQWARLDTLIDEVKANRKGFMTAYKVASLELLPKSMYTHACKSLEAKRKA